MTRLVEHLARVCPASGTTPTGWSMRLDSLPAEPKWLDSNQPFQGILAGGDSREYAIELSARRSYEAVPARRERPAEAIRRMQIALWSAKGWAEPYYWTAFTLEGDWR